MHFCTLTCHEWMHLFELTNSHDLAYNWFNILKRNAIDVAGYVIMPNHIHCILYLISKFTFNNLTIPRSK